MKSFIFFTLAYAANNTLMCKCGCETPSFHQVQSCSVCTRSWCSNVTVCPSDRTDFEIVCFQRGSAKDEFIIISFFIATFLMLAYALFLKPYLNGTEINSQRRTDWAPVDSAEVLDEEVIHLEPMTSQ
jgi:hypothetical protein